MPENVTLAALTFCVALLYSSVGHGGASGYLAVLTFFAVPRDQTAASALCLNLLVAGLSFRSFLKAKFFSWKFAAPFLIASVPAAFLGGLFKLPPSLYNLLLAGALAFAGIRLWLNTENKAAGGTLNPPTLPVAALTGGSIGLLSGMVGVGGGIFLSPLCILLRWAGPKETAAVSALFIFVNSASGLLGRYLRGSVTLNENLLMMLAAAFAGGLLGARLGAKHFPALWLRRILAAVLFLAVFKLVRTM